MRSDLKNGFMTQEPQYVWQIKPIYVAKGIPLKDIAFRWLKWRENNGDNIDYEMPRATFYRWVKAIRDQHGIDSQCRNGLYFIEIREVIAKGTVIKWMLDTIATGTLITENLDMSNRILVNAIPSGSDYLKPIIEAMKDNRANFFTLTLSKYSSIS